MADRLNAANTRNDIWKTAIQFLPDLGLSKVVFFDLSQPKSPLIISNACQDWTHGYAATVGSGQDPFPLNCLSRVDPVLTGIAHLEAHPNLDDCAREKVAQGSDALKIRTGMSITICPDRCGAGIGWNLMTPYSPREFAELRAIYEVDWRAWSQLTYAGLSKTTSFTSQLTVRERDCLALIADGLRTSDVADRLGIAETTAEMHLRNARHRLGAKTRDHAVAIAVGTGLV